jgi:hypothetical protein
MGVPSEQFVAFGVQVPVLCAWEGTLTPLPQVTTLQSCSHPVPAAFRCQPVSQAQLVLTVVPVLQFLSLGVHVPVLCAWEGTLTPVPQVLTSQSAAHPVPAAFL